MSDVSHPSGYEKSDANPRLIGALALGIACFLLVTPFMLLAGYPGADRAGRLPGDLPVPPAPRLQTNPRSDLERLRAYERARLTIFGWTDGDHQVARIPIDHAMRLLTERGLTGWPSQGR